MLLSVATLRTALELRRRLGTRRIPVFQLPSESDHFLPCKVALLTVVGVHGHLLLRTTEPVVLGPFAPYNNRPSALVPHPREGHQ
jgi:hypothetical protein